MGVGGLDGGGPVDMLATWCVRKLRGDARPSPYRVLSVAPVLSAGAYEPAVDVFALRQNPKTRSYSYWSESYPNCLFTGALRSLARAYEKRQVQYRVHVRLVTSETRPSVFDGQHVGQTIPRGLADPPPAARHGGTNLLGWGEQRLVLD